MALTTVPAQQVAAQLLAYQARLRRDRRLRYLTAAALAVGAGWLLLALGVYFDLWPAALGLLALVLAVALPAAALALEAWRAPSLAATARLLDGRLDNQQRWLTAAELLHTTASPMTTAQLATTARQLATVDPRAVLPVRRPWPAWGLSAGLVLLALGLLVLKGVPGGFSPLQAGSLPPTPLAGSAVPSPTASGLPGADSSGGAPKGDPGAPPPGAAQPGNPGAPGDATQQLAASRAAQAALDRLARALNEQSVTQQAGDALRQGNYDQAAQDLADVGAQSDQLSPAAQQGLAASLDAAAADSPKAPALRQAERNAANALRSGDYRRVEQGLKDLGDAIRQAGQQVVPQQQLAQGYPTPVDGGQAAPGQNDQSGPQVPSDQPAQAGQTPGPGGDANNPAASGDSNSAQANPPGATSDPNGLGNGSGGAPSSAPGSRISGPQAQTPLPNVAGNPFELETKPAPGQTRPALPGDPPALTLGGDTGSSSTTPLQPGSAGTAPGETNTVPVERWNTVQRYFSPDQQK